jgi:hypothetical protein
VAKFGAEAGEDAVHQIGVSHLTAEIAETVGQRLQARAVHGHGQVALLLPVKLVVEVHSPRDGVVEEEVLDTTPDRERRVIRRENQRQNLLRDRGVQPGDDGVVILDPFRVVVLRRGVAVDVVEGAELPERDDEEPTPHGEGGPLQIECDLNLLLDDHMAQILAWSHASRSSATGRDVERTSGTSDRSGRAMGSRRWRRDDAREREDARGRLMGGQHVCKGGHGVGLRWSGGVFVGGGEEDAGRGGREIGHGGLGSGSLGETWGNGMSV